MKRLYSKSLNKTKSFPDAVAKKILAVKDGGWEEVKPKRNVEAHKGQAKPKHEKSDTPTGDTA